MSESHSAVTGVDGGGTHDAPNQPDRLGSGTWRNAADDGVGTGVGGGRERQSARVGGGSGAGNGSERLNPLSPCGSCMEWIRKICEVNPAFSVVTFEDDSCEMVYLNKVHLS